MYYRSKSEFYFRQYVLPICTIVISIGLIFTGVYIYWASNSNNVSKQNLVTASNEPLKEENKSDDETLSLKDVNDLMTLPNLELSSKGLITEIKEDGKVTFHYNDKDYVLSMIGINIENSTHNLTEILTNDLLQKEVQVAFDNRKTDETNLYAYIYLNDKLYNEYLLENGVAKYKEEQNNTTYESNFRQAQAYAKQMDSGIWKK